MTEPSDPVVDRMAVGVGQASIQMAEVPADSDLESVVRRLADVPIVRDPADAVERARRVGGVSACDGQMGRDRSADRLTVYRAGIAGGGGARDAVQSSAEIAWPGP